MSTQPIFAPDGTVRQIPQENLQDALSAGGKRAVQMTDPSGTLRFIPEDQVSTAMQAGGKVYQPAPNTLGDMADVALQGLKGIAQISAPGIAASLINKTAPGLAAKMQQIPYIGPAMQQAAPLKNIPGMATATMAAPLAEGMQAGDVMPDPNAPRPQPAPTPPDSPSLLKIMSRHIPIVGRGLRAMDTMQELVNYGKPQPTIDTTPPAPAAPTGPPALWGKYATPELGQATSLGQVPPTGALPASQTGEALGQLRPAQPASQTPNVQAQPTIPGPQPSPESTPVQIGNLPQSKGNPYAPGPRTPAAMEAAQSGQIAKHGYIPENQTLVLQFQNGRVYDYRGVPQEVYDAYRNAESQGSFFAQNIKGRYQTGFRGSVPQLKGAKAAQALLDKSSSLAQRIPTSAGSPPAMENHA